MATAAEPETLAAAMASAFAEIEAATKDATNPHFKNKYAGLPQVIEAIKPALVAHGLFFTQRCHPAEDGVSVETVLHHSGGEKESLGILYVPANKRDAQGFGSALTYARRYALMTAFGVPAEDDDGNAAAKSTAANDRTNGQEAKPPAVIDDAQWAHLTTLCEQAKVSAQQVCTQAGVGSLKDIPAANYPGIVEALNRTIMNRTAKQKEPANA